MADEIETGSGFNTRMLMALAALNPPMIALAYFVQDKYKDSATCDPTDPAFGCSISPWGAALITFAVGAVFAIPLAFPSISRFLFTTRRGGLVFVLLAWLTIFLVWLAVIMDVVN